MIGTANAGYTFPGAVVPFGMVSFSPNLLAVSADKRNIPGGYLYAATPVRGFALTHLSGAGCAGSGDVPFMPITHGVTLSPALDTRAEAYTSPFSHANEHAEAGLYRVKLDNGVDDWNDLGGSNMNSRLVVGNTADGRIQLFSIGANRDVWSNWRKLDWMERLRRKGNPILFDPTVDIKECS